VNIPFGMT